MSTFDEQLWAVSVSGIRPNGNAGGRWPRPTRRGSRFAPLATAAGLSASRVHQLVVAADCDALDAALGELRAAGWSAPEDPDFGEDAELDGRDTIADRLSDEVGWLRRCANWLAQLDAGGYPPAVNLRPARDWPDTAHLPSMERPDDFVALLRNW